MGGSSRLGEKAETVQFPSAVLAPKPQGSPRWSPVSVCGVGHRRWFANSRHMYITGADGRRGEKEDNALQSVALWLPEVTLGVGREAF